VTQLCLTLHFVTNLIGGALGFATCCRFDNLFGYIGAPGTNMCLLVRDDDYTHKDELFTDLWAADAALRILKSDDD